MSSPSVWSANSSLCDAVCTLAGTLKCRGQGGRVIPQYMDYIAVDGGGISLSYVLLI